jgi:hypothetical protein
MQKLFANARLAFELIWNFLNLLPRSNNYPQLIMRADVLPSLCLLCALEVQTLVDGTSSRHIQRSLMFPSNRESDGV